MKTVDQIASRKNELALWLLSLDDESELRKVEALMAECHGAAQLTGPIPEEDLKMIAQGEADIAAGRYLTQGEFRALVERHYY
jgi:hypothetical protein